MQPRFRQVPPNGPASTMATDQPASATTAETVGSGPGADDDDVEARGLFAHCCGAGSRSPPRIGTGSRFSGGVSGHA